MKKSLISASRTLGISYSKLWNLVARIERATGRWIVEARKGGRDGGKAELTEFGRKLLEIYERINAKLQDFGFSGKMQKISEKPDLMISHSHDRIFSGLIEKLSEEFRVNSICLGSGMALMMLTPGEADVACAHLYEPKSGYNTAYLERLWIGTE
jgi:putative molybdopterin biosynthesis protein